MLGKFRDSMMGTPIVQGVSGFFTVTATGSCDMGSGYLDFLGVDIGAHINSILCSSLVDQIISIARAVVLAMASFAAFRIAVY